MAVVTPNRALVAAGLPTTTVLPPGLQQGEKTTNAYLKLGIGLAAVAAVIVADVIITKSISDGNYGKGTTPTVVTGLTIFATFFVAATAIERLLEPLSGWLPSTTDQKASASSDVKAAGSTVAAAADPTQPAVTAQTASAELQAAAVSIDRSSFSNFWKSTVLWALATIIAMLAAAGLRLYFLRTVGIAGGPRWEEILATGLIIGAGTKPLHDLVTYLQAASEAKKA